MSLLHKVVSHLPERLRHRLIRSQVKVVDEELEGITVRVASNVSEYEQAARLVHDMYVRRGIMEAHETGVRVCPHHLLPDSLVLVAMRGETVIGTIALIGDSALGLPMDEIYKDELDVLRAQGRRLAEVGALAIHPAERGQGVVYLLNRAMADAADSVLKADDLTIAVHPKAADIYRAALAFEVIGPERGYPGLNDSALALALRLNLKTSRETFRTLWGHLPKTAANPFYLYYERDNEQIEVPHPAMAHRDAVGRRRAIAHLVALRPDALAELAPREQAIVERLVPALRRSVTGPIRINHAPSAPIAI